MGFANFYCWFIRKYSQIGSTLTKLTSTLKPYSWSPKAQTAFDSLKKLFVTAPILIQTSDSGVGAVLSQREESSGKLKPCAFFSRKLSPAEQNYDIGIRELLAMKLSLEKWRHWLEGAPQSLIIWTDHKNPANFYALRKDSTHAKSVGVYSSTVLTWPSLTDLAVVTSNRMRSLANSTHLQMPPIPLSYPPLASWATSPGKSRPGFFKLKVRIPITPLVLMELSLYHIPSCPMYSPGAYVTCLLPCRCPQNP